MSKRSHRAQTAAQTVAITQGGEYFAPSGARVSLGDAVQFAVHQTELVTPGQRRGLCARADAATAARPAPTTTFDARNQTTFAAARALVDRFGPDRVAALNFASAKTPGGGFLNGSQAQEESLARASALYPCLLAQPAYYEANRRCDSSLYTDHLIFSPRVPVFRDDDDQLLEQPWEVSIMTAPAPNAGAIALNEPERVPDVEPTFRRRIELLLATAVSHGQTALVLGAWGCGVFRNDPAAVAGLFAEFLLPPGRFAQAFDHVSFAVLDRDGDTLTPFVAKFAASLRS
jgi:uncharacterized protein (TIGR02452 family)